MSLTNDLQDVVRALICSYSAEVPISAETIAADAIAKLDPSNASPILVQWACVLELRQLAREVLRTQYTDEKTSGAQGELFTGLQDRYPGFGNNAGKYMPRKLMTREDYRGNIARLRREASAKLAHSDALEAEGIELFGSLDDEDSAAA